MPQPLEQYYHNLFLLILILTRILLPMWDLNFHPAWTSSNVWSHTSNSSLGSTPPQILPLQVHASTLLFVFIIWLPLFFQYSISCSTTFLVTGLSSIHHPNSPQETLLQIQHFLSDPILLHTSNSLLESTPPHLLPLQVHAPTLLFSFIVWLILFFQHSIFYSTISNLY